MPRRRAGALLPIERDVLRIAAARAEDGERFHGFGLAEALSEAHGRRLIAHGTLYKALARMVEARWLEALWEDPEPAHRERRPRRRLYAITAEGQAALARAEAPVRTAFSARAAGVGA